uniref:(northern house mosquito) hypothetical protein n=1 Tax=Culex pipiens TaxID=7175 RepID=A0A8D8BDE7_CULPI
MTTGRRLRRFLRWTGQLFCWIVAGVRPAGVVTTTTTATSTDCEVCSIRPSASCVRTTVPLLFLLRLVGQSPRGTDTRNVLLLAIDSGTSFRFHDTSNALWLLFEPQLWPLAGANLAGAGRRNNHNNTPCPCTISQSIKKGPPNLPLCLLLTAGFFLVELLFLLPPRINLA